MIETIIEALSYHGRLQAEVEKKENMKEIVDNNELERWTFGINANQLVELVLEDKKTATTYLYVDDEEYKENDISILTDINGNDVCLIQTKKIIITTFKNITWDLAFLEGENNSLDDWRKEHYNFFKKITPSFNKDTKVVFEIFEVIEKL